MRASSSRRSLAGSRSESFSDLQGLASGPRKRSQSPARRVARRLTLQRLLAVVIASALVLQVLQVRTSPGLSPGLQATRASDLAAILQLRSDALPASASAGGAAGAGAPAAAANGTAAPLLIPRLIHHGNLAGAAAGAAASRSYVESWQVLNPGWEVRLYDERGAAEFVRAEYPQYLAQYRALALPAQRRDFFRYLVVLRHGGVYADGGTECRAPLNALLRSRDTLVVGWETDLPSPEAALDASFVRQRQLLRWVFAAAPGHPALRELAERVSAAAGRTAALDPLLEAEEATGAGLFTDVVLKHAEAHRPGKHDDPWSIRILPRVCFGAPAAPGYGLTPTDPAIVALHHPPGAPGTATRGGAAGGSSGGSQQSAWGWPWRRKEREQQQQQQWGWGRFSRKGASGQEARGPAEPADRREAQLARMRAAQPAGRLYPVSMAHDPPYDLMAHAAGDGDPQSGWDVCAAATAHGSWQPSVQPRRAPSLVDAVVGSLSGADALVDVGAGYGVLTLAAAARGHRVHAFELEPRALAGLEAGVARNGFSSPAHLLTHLRAASPVSPSSPRHGECTVGSAPSRLSKLFHFDSLLHEGGGDEIDSKERWWARFDSSSLNAAPEETDMSVWRHGSFKVADPVHCLHYNEQRREAGLEPVPCAAEPGAEPGAAPPQA